MFRFTIRELVLMAIAAAVTAIGMYAAWQADRAVLALRLSQMQVRAQQAESQWHALEERNAPATVRPEGPAGNSPDR